VVKVFDNLRLRLDTVLGYEEILPMGYLWWMMILQRPLTCFVDNWTLNTCL
jgi:hypothetical protein